MSSLSLEPMRRLQQLASAVCDETATDEQINELDLLLRASPEAALWYVRWMDLHFELDAQLPLDFLACSDEHFVTTKPRTLWQRIVRPTPVSLGVATVVLGILLAAMAVITPPIHRYLTDPRGAPAGTFPPGVVAQITGTSGAIWREPRRGADEGAQLTAGTPLALELGLVEITFASGAKVILEGPAAAKFDSSDRCTLIEGRMVGHVPPQAAGFAVATRRWEVIDLGTEFGLEIDDHGDIHVAVFEGKVQVASTNSSTTHELAGGESAQTTTDGQLQIEASGPLRSFVRQLPQTPGDSRGEVIAYKSALGMPGTQDFGGALGLDFVVVRPIEVTRLGAFDNGADGMNRPITVELWRRDDAGTPLLPDDDRGVEIVATQQFSAENAGKLAGSNRLLSLANPVVLEPGAYTIVAHGYGAGELASNEGPDPTTRRFKSRNSGQGAIEFVGGSRYGAANTFPNTADTNANPQQYAAGTFAFRVCDKSPK